MKNVLPEYRQTDLKFIRERTDDSHHDKRVQNDRLRCDVAKSFHHAPARTVRARYDFSYYLANPEDFPAVAWQCRPVL